MSEPPPPYRATDDNGFGVYMVIRDISPNEDMVVWMGESKTEALIERDRLNAKWIKDRDEREADDA